MNNQQVAHVWAQQTKKQTINGSHFYAEGPTIFSYGQHFPIARFVTPSVILFTSRSRSNSTTRHKSYVILAIGSQTRYVVPNVMADTKEQHQENFDAMRSELESLIVDLGRKRDKVTAVDQIESLVKNANGYAKEFKLRSRIKVPVVIVAASADAAKKVKSRRLAAIRKEAAKKAAKDAADLAKWLTGESIRVRCDKVHLRAKGDTVQTTLGAEFPLSHCERVLKFITRIRERGTTWHKNGEACPIGLFQIDQIEATGDIKAGCHNVEFEEIKRFAESIGLTA